MVTVAVPPSARPSKSPAGCHITWLPTTVTLPWPAGTVASVTVSVSPSRSRSLASTSMATGASSVVAAVSACASGRVFSHLSAR